ncbi:MAG: peptidylprolyl isomerase [Acutalibacteraceae bacterium]
MKKIISLVLVAALCMFSFAACGKSTDEAATQEETTSITQATTSVAETTNEETTKMNKEATFPKVKITVKDYGEIELKLNDEQAPITVANFVKLVKQGFYDGLTFHRIMQGFMIQGGDPEGTGMGGSDETIKGEFAVNGVNNNISHKRGVISMARSSAYDSASSQFFICDADSTFLDGQYAAFGEVTKGLDVVDKIAADAKPVDDNGTIPADEQPVIEKIEIIK